MAKKKKKENGLDDILQGFKEALARKLNSHPDTPPEQINLNLNFQNKPRKISIVILETEVDG